MISFHVSVILIERTLKHVRKFLQKEKSNAVKWSCIPDVEKKQQIREQEADEQHEEDTEDKGIFSQDRISFPVTSITCSDATGFDCSSTIINPKTFLKNLPWPSTPSFSSSSTGTDPHLSVTDKSNPFLEVQEYSCHHPDAIRTTFHHTFSVISNTQEFKSRYKELNIIGEGGFGLVYAGERQSDSKPVAIKHIAKKVVKFVRVNCQGNVYNEILEVFLMEQAAGRLCDGSFENRAVIGLIETFVLETEVIIIMERPSDTVDMLNYFIEVKCIPEGQAKVILKQIVNIALLMHKNGVFHRDLKLDNLLVQRNQGTPEIRLIDFGCADFVEHEPFRLFFGTPEFAPPECFRAETYKAEPLTVFQIGTILYMVCTSGSFNTKEYMKTGNKVPKCVSKECNDFLSRCLALDPKQRPTLEDLILHPWLE